jgi:hypothetical protein
VNSARVSTTSTTRKPRAERGVAALARRPQSRLKAKKGAEVENKQATPLGEGLCRKRRKDLFLVPFHIQALLLCRFHLVKELSFIFLFSRGLKQRKAQRLEVEPQQATPWEKVIAEREERMWEKRKMNENSFRRWKRVK